MKRKNFRRRFVSILLILTMLAGMNVGFAEPSPESGVTDDFSVKDLLEFSKLLTGLVEVVEPESAILDAIDWGADVLEYIFGFGEGQNPMSDEERAYFESILKDLDTLLASVEDLQSTVNSQYLATLLNDFNHTIDKHTPWNVFDALDHVDRAELTEEAMHAEHLRVLTSGIGIDEAHWESCTEYFDTYAEHLANVMLTPFEVTLDGQSQSMMLMQVLHAYLCRKYHWEHQGLEEWQSFQASAVTLMIETLTIEKYSLLARIELIKENNKDPDKPKKTSEVVASRLQDVQGWLNQAHKLYSEEDAWLPKPVASETERYYWTPGHETLFDLQVTNQHLPKESSEDIGWVQCDELQGVAWNDSWQQKMHTVWAFWKPFFRPVQLLTEKQANTIYEDYGKKKSFYEIFISESEGNFQGLVGDPNADDWKLIIDPNTHHLDVQINDFYDVIAYFYDATKKGDAIKAEPMRIAWYDVMNNEVFDGTDFIGLHVKSSSIADNTEDEVHLGIQNNTSAGWTVADGSVEIGLDESQGRPLSVWADGTELDPSCYELSERSAVISEAYLSTLAAGSHVFVVHAERGTMTLTMNIGKYEMLILPESTERIEAEAFKGTAAEYVVVSQRCQYIGAEAFSDCPNLLWIALPDKVSIGENAFRNCPNAVFLCADGSDAARYADENGIPHRRR